MLKKFSFLLLATALISIFSFAQKPEISKYSAGASGGNSAESIDTQNSWFKMPTEVQLTNGTIMPIPEFEYLLDSLTAIDSLFRDSLLALKKPLKPIYIGPKPEIIAISPYSTVQGDFIRINLTMPFTEDIKVLVSSKSGVVLVDKKITAKEGKRQFNLSVEDYGMDPGYYFLSVKDTKEKYHITRGFLVNK